MRRLPLLTPVLITVATVVSACAERADPPTAPRMRVPFVALANAATCGEPTSVALLAGQTIGAGTVIVSNDEDNLYVTYTTSAPWRLAQTHLAVATSLADIPRTATGSPEPGQFAYRTTHGAGVTEFVYTIPLADLGAEPGDARIVAAHADVWNASTSVSEGAWGAGTRFVSKGNWATYFAYTVQACRPAPGRDVVVFNDVNVFDDNGLQNPNNVLLVQNLVGYTTAGPRGTGSEVWFDCGRNAAYPPACTPAHATLRSTIVNAGFTLTDVSSSSGSIATIPASVKVVFLWTPMVPYTSAEINVLKQFAAEGGRIVFIGEWDGFYGAGIALENEFLADMGAVMTNIGQAVDCGYNDLPAASIREHQITTGMTGVRVACASVIVPGPNDFALFYDLSNTRVLAGVATIDITPLPLLAVHQSRLQSVVPRSAVVVGGHRSLGTALNPASPTGMW